MGSLFHLALLLSCGGGAMPADAAGADGAGLDAPRPSRDGSLGADGSPGTDSGPTLCERPSDLRFTAEVVSTDLGGPWTKELGDVDGDGDLDAVLAGGDLGPEVHWLRHPDWTPFLIGRQGGDDWGATGDVNGDGAIDVVVNGTPRWYENPAGSGGDPTGLWVEHPIDGTDYHDLALVDVDGDGRLDVVLRHNSQQTKLCLQASAGDFACAELPNGMVGEGTAVADLDRDGRRDIVGNGFWLRQPADPADAAGWTRHDFDDSAPAHTSAATADLNGDGRTDILLAASESSGDLFWYEAPPDAIAGAWTRHRVDASDHIHRMHLVDADGDADLDIFIAEMHTSATDRVGILLAEGATWRYAPIDMTGSHNIAIGDVEGDGDVDVLGANFSSAADDGGIVRLWRSERCGG